MTDYKPGLFGNRMLPRDAHKLVYHHGWQDPLNMTRMVAVLEAESSLYTEAVGRINPDGSQDFGLFQLNDSHWSRFALSRDEYVIKAFDPEAAATIARVLWSDDKHHGGNGFGPWAAYRSGAYTKYLPVGCTGLANFAAVELIGAPVIA